jgi:acetyl esterase/lipase
MSSRHLVDPELLAALDQFPPPARDQAGLDARRAMLGPALPSRESYRPPHITIEDHRAPGLLGAPNVDLLLFRPSEIDGPLPAYLHIHGGGYIFGNAEMCGPQNVRTAAGAQCIVVSVDYRLAPETRAPGSMEDCYAALAWLHENADALGVNRSRIAVGGESAGGGLAAALALRARDRGELPICFQMLIAPMLDDRTAVRTDTDPIVGEFVWTREQNHFGWTSLLGREPGSPDISPYCAPGRATDLSRLPPAYIGVGALDLFRDEDVDYAYRLMCAGVPAELHVVPGAYHGFERAADAAIVRLAEAERLMALKHALYRRADS